MGLVKLAAKNDKKYAKYTPAGSIISPAIIGASGGTLLRAGLQAAGIHRVGRFAGTAGLLGGLAYGIKKHHDLSESGEFDKKVKRGYKGTITGGGAFASSLLPIIGPAIYHGVKANRYSSINRKDNEDFE